MFTHGIVQNGGRPRGRGIARAVAIILVTVAAGAATAQPGAEILVPAPFDQLFITPPPAPNPTQYLDLARVTVRDTIDAFYYELQVTGPAPTTLMLSDFLAGDHVVTNFVLPPETMAGLYELRCLAYDSGGLPIGDWSDPVPVEVLEMAAVPFAPSASQTVSGTVMASDVMIPSGVTLTVDEKFTLLSVGPVYIGGELIGLPGPFPGTDGADITVTSVGEITLEGSVIAGEGTPGDDVLSGDIAVAGGGGGGGSVVIMTNQAPLTIMPTAVIHSGNGGGGGRAQATGIPATNPGDLGGAALARGGDGGAGGDLIVYAAGGPFSLPLVPGMLYCGGGGWGGGATATGGTGGPGDVGVVEGPGGGADATGGAGGSSGSLYVDARFLDANGDLILDLAELQIVGGGAGGSAGIVEAVGGDNGTPLAKSFEKTPSCFRPNGAKPATVYGTGNKGGDGWVNPGMGMIGIAAGIPGPPGGDGGDAVARGGDGGDLKTIGVSIGGFSLGWSTVSFAGNAGDAIAVGGAGGAPSGSGGNATATGGNGGNAVKVGLANGGGKGGDARATGGHGQRGPDCCRPPQPNPHNGGNGGGATATGGNGGTGSKYGGNGGNAHAAAGHCGDGGDGNGPSSGGQPGPANATGGNGGSALIFNGSNGTAKKVPANACKQGKLCAPQCTSEEVKAKDSADQVDGVDDCQETEGDKALVPCAVFCPAGDLAVIDPALQYVSGTPVTDLPADRYGVMAASTWFGGDVPTDPSGHGAISYAAVNVDAGYGCKDSYIMACGTYVAGPIKVMSVDINADGRVDQGDADALAAHIGTSETCFDLTGDGLVNLTDAMLLQQHFGHAHPLSAVEMAAMSTQNLSAFPNPLNPRTVVSYFLSASGQVTVKVVDLKGRLVRVLVDESQLPGLHQVPWSGADVGGRPVASGVYLVVLETARGLSTEKVAVLK